MPPLNQPDTRIKPHRSGWRRAGIALGVVAVVLSTCFFLRPLFAETLDLTVYSAQRDAGAYLALPMSGSNFSMNSYVSYSAGRMYLKGNVGAAVLAAYADLAGKHPEWKFVYGEMGLKGGGRFWPHRTHKDGTSADFMTPVYTVDSSGKQVSTPLPCTALNLWGYGVRMNDKGQSGEYHLDAAAMIAHIAALRDAAPRYGLGIRRVIFDPPLLALLRAEPSFARIQDITFMQQKAWFPHDGHYHVDFVKK